MIWSTHSTCLHKDIDEWTLIINGHWLGIVNHPIKGRILIMKETVNISHWPCRSTASCIMSIQTVYLVDHIWEQQELDWSLMTHLSDKTIRIIRLKEVLFQLPQVVHCVKFWMVTMQGVMCMKKSLDWCMNAPPTDLARPGRSLLVYYGGTSQKHWESLPKIKNFRTLNPMLTFWGPVTSPIPLYICI